MIVVLCAVLAGLLALPKLRSRNMAAAGSNVAVATPPSPAASRTSSTPVPPPPAPNAVTTTLPTHPVLPATSHVTAAVQSDPSLTNLLEAQVQKPLPVLERDYTATTNRDSRLDVMMDIAETQSADGVKSLTRLFEQEADPDLKVDLLDSLLGIDGFKDEKLIMLTLGIRPGLPNEVRQSAIDGLIDLEDTRSIALLNGLLNDPDAEIRQAAQDAIDLIQAPPDQVPKLN